MRALFRLNGWLVRVLCVLSVVLIVAMMLGICAEVMLRIAGFPSIVGLVELTEYALFASTFFVAPYLLRTNQHVRVDIVMSRVDPEDAKRVECGALAVIMAISAVAGVVGALIMLKSASDGTLVFKDLIFPRWWLEWIIPLSALAMLLQALEMLLELLRSRATPHDADEHIPGIRSEDAL